MQGGTWEPCPGPEGVQGSGSASGPSDRPPTPSLLRPLPPSVPPSIAQDTTKLLWGLARLHWTEAPGLLDAIGHRLAAHDGAGLAPFNAQEVSTVAWAYGTLGHRHPPVLAALAARALDPPLLAAFTPQGLLNLCGTYARLHIHPKALKRAVSAHFRRRDVMASLRPRDYSDVVRLFVTWLDSTEGVPWRCGRPLCPLRAQTVEVEDGRLSATGPWFSCPEVQMTPGMRCLLASFRIR